MNKLEALNVIMERHKHGVTVPLALKISVGGKWHTVTIDRDDKNIQKTARVLVMMMLRSEVEKTTKVVNRSEELLVETPKDYTVCVWGSAGRKDVTIRAHSPMDARVMAFIYHSDKRLEQQILIDLVHANTEIVS